MATNLRCNWIQIWEGEAVTFLKIRLEVITPKSTPSERDLDDR